MKQNARPSGFTLVEAAVAIAVVAILSGIIVPLVVKNIRDSQAARAKNDLQVIAGAVASQLKDTGGRPIGANNNTWQSGTGNGTFTQLFTSTVANGNTLFFATAPAANAEFAYKGPYMSAADAAKTDPWGSPYRIYGYNGNGQTNNSAVFVVSLGPNKATTANLNTNPAAWPAAGTATDDIVVPLN